MEQHSQMTQTQNFSDSLDSHLNFNKHVETLKIRTTRRLNVMRCVKGKDWGANPKLLLTTYKVLIRPIIDYTPFIYLSMSPATLLKVERIQRAAARIITYWPMYTNTNTIYQQLNIPNILDRSLQLSASYIQKASQSNPLIKDLIKSYKNSIETNEGCLSKNPKPTTLSFLMPFIAADSEPA